MHQGEIAGTVEPAGSDEGGDLGEVALAPRVPCHGRSIRGDPEPPLIARCTVPPVHVGLLGGLEVLDGDRDVAVPGTKLRTLLAVLALHPGRVVPAEQLVDVLWGEDPPAGVRNSLQGLVSKLRRVLGAGGLVAMRGSGYVLDLPPDAVDLHRFERLVADGRAAAAAGDLAGAVDLLTEAGGLWRGDALADFAYEDFAAPVATRLSELWLAAVEERLDLELQLGRHAGVVVELEPLVAAHPLRDRLRGLLMVALYRTGRQADALRVFQEGRHLLGEELGLEPGPDLRRLEAAILAQDAALAGPPVEARTRTPAPVTRSTIPESLSPLVGRDEEVAELTALAAASRLLTLVGPGGVGKTRLALEVARLASADLADGGCLVEFAPLGDPDGVPTAIAAALDLPDPTRLAELIGDREMLLVLDNCEHVIAPAAAVAEELLSRCPALRLIATSREGLRVGGETVWPVPPLALDGAVELFITRARAAGAAIEPSHAVADICERLDGLPLAIELAAARMRAFPVDQLAGRLHDRFRLLTGGSRTALPRQQTLRAVVDWSYELLFDDEQRVFERLSVFPGGFDLATAEAVCTDDVLDAADIADHVHALVEKSLVHVVRRGDDIRFAQLQTLCQYGREKLAERGDAGPIRNAMAGHFARLCAQSATAFTGDIQRSWLRSVDQEHDNLRAALEWAVDTGDAETALAIAGGAAWPHWLAGSMVEGKRWIDAAFACDGEASERTRALALTGRGLLGFLTGSPDPADADLEEALAIARRHDELAIVRLAHSFYAEIAAARGDVDEARRRRLDVLAFYGDDDDHPFDVAARAYSMGKLAILDGDIGAAEQHYRAAAEGFSDIDRPVMYSMSLGMVADFDEAADDWDAARRTLEAAIATNDSLGLRSFTSSLVARLGWVLLHLDDIDGAEHAYGRALEEGRRLQHTQSTFVAQAGMAVVHRLRGRDRAAFDAATEAVELFRAGAGLRFRNRVDPRNDLLAAASASYSVLADLAAERGDTGQAEQLRAEVAALGQPTPPFLAAGSAGARQ